MGGSRYKQSRTLVRRLCRLPGEDFAEFRQKVARLRQHFEQFNLDVSGLCQWLMGMRKRNADPEKPEGFGSLGDYLLQGKLDDSADDEDQCDRRRKDVFDHLAGIDVGPPLPSGMEHARLRQAIMHEFQIPPTTSARQLFSRMSTKSPAHRLVLLKAASEWIIARFQRGMENWQRQHRQWAQEKSEWEAAHPDLTPEVRERFTEIFKNLHDPENSGKLGVRRKNPRICPGERLRQNMDNCIYAGQKGHGPLCWRYVEFTKQRKKDDPHFNPDGFWKDAEKLVRFCVQFKTKPANAFLSSALPATLFEKLPAQGRGQAVNRLKANFNAYLQFMGLNHETILAQKRLPHCRKIGKTWEESECRFNPHTELCQQYRQALGQLDESTLAQEKTYRQWRKLYLSGPRKPQFHYPSSRRLPMPKIFGADFHRIDLDGSILRLRLDDMPAGQWLELGFIPWPNGYHPSRGEVAKKITSVHVNFIGSRARAGFRFDVPHKNSRFSSSQDELDRLRSQVFPREAQDREFLHAARELLLKSFDPGQGPAPRRLLAVDLGETGAAAGVFSEEKHEKDIALEIIKIDTHYATVPEILKKDMEKKPPPKFAEDDARGLRRQHVARHLAKISAGAAAIAGHRASGASVPATLETHDFRSLKRHIQWMIRDWARVSAACIVAAAEKENCDLIVFESMRGFRLPGYDQIEPDKKRRLAQFAFGRVRRKVVEKAVERGMRVVTVPYFKSSQVCAQCGSPQENLGLWRKNKTRGHKFKCEKCKFEIDSDANAARVLGRVFWGKVELPES
ncbi:MAG TPA: zinc ribbon domain-containing protein [Verrucomicrobiae bacterium]|nr:zinc ribbon domain-containing protein [Verrucomicrobiae bacterium]HVX84081.1 zinc ribbon domain-containing protein [Phycisphaerae bacterium]